jgi:hypothetical protein
MLEYWNSCQKTVRNEKEIIKREGIFKKELSLYRISTFNEPFPKYF